MKMSEISPNKSHLSRKCWCFKEKDKRQVKTVWIEKEKRNVVKG